MDPRTGWRLLSATDVVVRRATVDDAYACSVVLSASIRELCVADHQGNEAHIERWTRNKTPQSVRGWIESGRGILYVAEIDGDIVGVGGTDGVDSITVNYVAPRYRFKGVSKALLVHMEKELATGGATIAKVSSSLTAVRFYTDNGWEDSGEREWFLGVEVPGLTKVLKRP